VFAVNSLDFASNYGQTAIGFTESQTDLARVLTPPAPPVVPQQKAQWQLVIWALPWLFFTGNAYLSWSVICGATGAERAQYWADLHVGATVCTLIAIAISLWIVRKAREAYRPDARTDTLWRQHYEQMARWNTLWYCPACDSVFDPATSAVVPVTRMRSLL